jgi:hypothetical protein
LLPVQLWLIPQYLLRPSFLYRSLPNPDLYITAFLFLSSIPLPSSFFLPFHLSFASYFPVTRCRHISTMKITSAVAFFSLLASGQATGAVCLNSYSVPLVHILTRITFSTGAPTNSTPARVDRLTSVMTTRTRVSAGLTSLLALSPTMVASPSLVSLAAMASVPALASVV